MNQSRLDIELTIGAIAARTGCSVPTIRYYEQIGLIPRARRRESGHRVYGAATEELLTFIRHCREFGFPVEQVRELLALTGSDGRDCAATRAVAQAQLDRVRAKRRELRVLEQGLDRFVASCTEACLGGPTADCTILKDLQQPPRLAEALESSTPRCCG